MAFVGEIRNHDMVGPRLSIGLAVLSIACGRIAFETRDDPAQDAPTGDGSAPIECSMWMDTRPETAVNSTSNDWEPALSPDGRLLVFASSRSGVFKLYSADRAAVGNPFGAATLIAELDDAGSRHASPTWDPDGTKFYFTRDGVAMVASYDPNTRTFSQVQETNALLGTSWDVASAGRELFYSFTVVSGDTDLGHATRLGLGDPWTPDSDVDALSQPASREGFPSFAEATQELFIEVSVPSVAVWKSTRAGPGFAFGPAVLVPELVNAGDPEVSRDGLEVYYSSDEARSMGSADIFVGARSCK